MNLKVKMKSKQQSILGRIMGYFPLLHLILIFLCFYFFVAETTVLNFIFVFGSIYLFPLFVFRVHQLIFPLKEGRWIIPNGQYPPWWGSYHIQMLFLTFPFLESVLRLIPGCFSMWLRLWGSQIGRRVIWAPRLEITDRSLIEVGDFTVMGLETVYISHVMNPTKEGRVLLIVKKIKIGSFCFIGSGSRMGPGAVVLDKTKLDVLTDLKADHYF